MCVNDWRWGTLIRAQPTAISLAAAATRTFPNNPQRAGISFFGASASAVNIALLSVDGIQIGLIGGLGATPNVHFTLATCGDLPTRAFVLTGSGAGFTGGAIEYLAPQAYLTAAIEEFRRLYPDTERY